MFYKNLCSLCEKNNTSVTAVLLDLGYSSSKGTAWKSGALPKYEIIKKLSEYFSVPVYTLFLEGEETPSIELSKEQKEIFDLFSKLNIKGKNKATEYIADLTENEKYTYYDNNIIKGA